jgi:antitoxin (DNA-binding transcriptional repressor) of toxin-antitoxin stability system
MVEPGGGVRHGGAGAQGCTDCASCTAEAVNSTEHLGIEQARKRFPELVSRAAAGERIVICRHHQPLAALVPLAAAEAPVGSPPAASTLLGLRGSGRHCWGAEGSTQPNRPPSPPPQRPFDPRQLTQGSRIAFDGSALVAFLSDAQGTGDFLGPLLEGISQGYWRGVLSSLSLMRVLEGPLACGDETLCQRYSHAFGSHHWDVVSPDLTLTTTAARLRLQEPALDTTAAMELATAIHSGAAVLVTDEPKLAQTGQHPVLSALRP